MRPHATPVSGIMLAVALGLSLTGCSVVAAGPSGAVQTLGTTASASPSAADPVADEMSVARAKAQSWLDAVSLPSGAVRTEESPGRFSSYTGWPCGPTAEMNAYWRVPGVTVSDMVDWLREHPVPGLGVPTRPSSYRVAPDAEEAMIAFIPAQGAQEGIVYSIERTSDGIGMRGEIAALTASAVCPTPPGGGEWGAPGQG